jgi:hypothetical protein
MNFGRGGDRHDSLAEGHCMIFYPQNVVFLLQKAGFTVKSNEMIAKKTKLDPMVKLLVALGFWRKDCQFFRFKTTAIKP